MEIFFTKYNYILIFLFLSFSYFIFRQLFNLPNARFTLPGSYNPNARGSDSCKGNKDYDPKH